MSNVSLINGYIDEPKDMVKVVRCNKCRKYVPDIIVEKVGWCEHLERGMYYTDFCSYGERKETECK